MSPSCRDRIGFQFRDSVSADWFERRRTGDRSTEVPTGKVFQGNSCVGVIREPSSNAPGKCAQRLSRFQMWFDLAGGENQSNRTNRAKTPILQGEICPRKLNLEELRWVFAPVAVSSFEGAPWPYVARLLDGQNRRHSWYLLRIPRAYPATNSTGIPKSRGSASQGGSWRPALRRGAQGKVRRPSVAKRSRASLSVLTVLLAVCPSSARNTLESAKLKSRGLVASRESWLMASNEFQRLLLQNAAFTPPCHIVSAITKNTRTLPIPNVPRSIAEELWHIIFWQDHFLRCARREHLAYPQHAKLGWRRLDSLSNSHGRNSLCGLSPVWRRPPTSPDRRGWQNVIPRWKNQALVLALWLYWNSLWIWLCITPIILDESFNCAKSQDARRHGWRRYLVRS